MLKRLVVKNFKSLADFSIDFEPLTVLIGQNGSGKTTVLQALDLLGAFLRGDVNHYLEQLGWDAGDLVSKVSENHQIEFSLTFVANTATFVWTVIFEKLGDDLQVISETIRDGGKSKFFFESNFADGGLSLITSDGFDRWLPELAIRFKQSILRALKIQSAPAEIEVASNALEKIFLLDIDSIDLLRKPAKFKTVENIGNKGEHLASFLHGYLNPEQRELLDATFKRFIPQIQSVATRDIGGTVFLSLIENFPLGSDSSAQKEIDPNHISDGTLQILALLATIQGAKPGQILLLDEIENGIDPNHLELLVELLAEAIEKRGIQVILASHSPVILNYVSEKGVRYFSREANGNVVAQNPFDRKEIKSMLEYMGPGEVWLNLKEEDLTNKN